MRAEIAFANRGFIQFLLSPVNFNKKRMFGGGMKVGKTATLAVGVGLAVQVQRRCAISINEMP